MVELAVSLAARLGLGEREMVSLVGGGGKSTLLFTLGAELAAAGKRVLLTTTTKMGREQADWAAAICWSAETRCAVAALNRVSPVMLVTDGDGHKVTGPTPEIVDQLYASYAADYVIVEADGSRGMPLKAPAAHEPVIPAATTVVVIMMGIDAVGRPLAEVTHRVEEACRLTDLAVDHVMTPTDCVNVLLHEEGALRRCPASARVIVAITKVTTDSTRIAAEELSAIIATRRPDITPVVIPVL